MCVLDRTVVEVKLSRGLVAIVDAEDFEKVSRYKWCATRGRNTDYAQRKSGGRTVLLHRVIMNAPRGVHIDHINRNGLDNRKTNLRFCTPSQNLRNSRKRCQINGCTSVFKGVCKHHDGRKTPWTATVQVNGKRQSCSFTTELAAARWYDKKAREYHGEFARPNFP